MEENANAKVFNNLMVNCKFLAMTPAWNEGGEDCYDRDNSVIDYNFYASGTVASSIFYEGSYEDDGEMFEYSGVKIPYEGYAYAHAEYDTEKADLHSIIAKDAEKAEELDPMFASYDLDVDPSKLLWNKTEVSDFYLQSGSPALSGTCPASQYTPYFASDGIRIEGTGKTYTSPAVTAQFGALGTK